jgi:hypothetical protein
VIGEERVKKGFRVVSGARGEDREPKCRDETEEAGISAKNKFHSCVVAATLPECAATVNMPVKEGCV